MTAKIPLFGILLLRVHFCTSWRLVLRVRLAGAVFVHLLLGCKVYR